MVIYDQTTKHKSDLCFTGVFLTFPGQWRWAWRCNILWDVPTWLGTLCGNPWVRWIGRIDDGLSRALKFHCCSKKCILTWPATPYTISFYVKSIYIYIYIYILLVRKFNRKMLMVTFPAVMLCNFLCVHTADEWMVIADTCPHRFCRTLERIIRPAGLLKSAITETEVEFLQISPILAAKMLLHLP